MDNEKLEMLKFVDHTALKPFVTYKEIEELCNEAIKYHTASVCVPPCYVKRIKKEYGDKVNICTVIGFPLGYQTLESKLAECESALKDGANEIDMVVNIADIKNKEYKKVEDEIIALKHVVKNKILKVIIETCFLTEDEKIVMCEIISKSGADYIKTSTGFGTHGAMIEDIRLFKKHLRDGVKIKAAGGIKTLDDLSMFINEGCSRIGSSSSVKLVKCEIDEIKGY